MGLIFKAKRQVRPAFVVVLALVLMAGGCFAAGSAVIGIEDSRDQEASDYLQSQGLPVQVPNQRRPVAPTWTGAFRVTDQGVDMNSRPPATDVVGGKATVTYDGDRQVLSTQNAHPAALWTDGADPTYEQCVNVLQTQALSFNEALAVPYRQGDGLCVLTFGKQSVAFVRGTSPPGAEAVQMRGIRWPAPAWWQ